MMPALPIHADYPAGTILSPAGVPVTAESFPTAYEGASMSDRLSDFGLSSIGPSGNASSISSLRKRARTLERNDPSAKKGIDSYVSNLVGTDISPLWDSIDNEEQRDEIQELWDDSQQEADYYGVSDFYGTQEIICRSMVRDGEGLGRFHHVHPDAGLLVPLQVQVIEGDHLDAGYNDISPEGNEIRYGIEWKGGRRYKYWLYRDHPGEMFLTGTDLTRVGVPAGDVSHVFRPLRAGQARGISWLSPILVMLHDINQYNDFEIQRKKAASLFGGFIYKDNQIDHNRTRNPVVGGKETSFTSGTQTVKVGGATFPILTGNDRISFSQPGDVGNNYLAFMKTEFRLIAAGLGITYEQLTGDLEGVNYTSLRAGLIEFRRLCETIILRTLVFQYCRPYINRWIPAAILNGSLKTVSISEYLQNKRKFHRVSWHPHGWDFVDPVKDRIAEKMDIRNGINTRGNVISRRGRNIYRVDKGQESDRKNARDRGLVYDSDPGQTNDSGAMQKIEEKIILDAATTE
ncbi:MAG: phage portal protein [Proteobacteria bacterium]|nr:phage portal protein [Pseudomonadota bacterium]MBU1418931.1 phage portal protein [Pseudomonadota bacterium]MBU1455748.1 phage portal protein [Pseudomonadota bacterium]